MIELPHKVRLWYSPFIKTVWHTKQNHNTTNILVNLNNKYKNINIYINDPNELTRTRLTIIKNALMMFFYNFFIYKYMGR